MPIYEYKCRSCGQEMEIFLKTYDTSNVRCTGCGSDQLDKQWSTPAVITHDSPSTQDLPCCGHHGHSHGSSGEGCGITQCPANRGFGCGMQH